MYVLCTHFYGFDLIKILTVCITKVIRFWYPIKVSNDKNHIKAVLFPFHLSSSFTMCYISWCVNCYSTGNTCCSLVVSNFLMSMPDLKFN